MLEFINKDKFELHVINLGTKEKTPIANWCAKLNIPFYFISYQGKKDIPLASFKCLRLLKKIKADIVHAHLIDAGMIGLSAAKILGIKKRIYTRHHSTLHHEYYPSGVKYDKYINSISTDIIAISKNVQDVLINEGVNPTKIHLIHHGFYFKDFENISQDRIRDVKKKYNPNNQKPVIGVISRYLDLKGITYIIKAFKQYLVKYPNALLLIANAFGPDELNIKTELQNLPDKNYLEIPFENDVIALYKLFDVFVHVPINPNVEAFGLIYVESMLCGIPGVFTLSGVAPEFITHLQNAYVVNFKSSNEIYKALVILTENKELRNKIINTGKEILVNNFSVNLSIAKHEIVYCK